MNSKPPSILRMIGVNAGILLLATLLTVVVLLLWNEGANTNFVPFRYMFF